MKKSVQVTISGKVQGVGFRYFCNQKARQLDVSGFVKNRADGSVYVEAEGSEENLYAFVEYCKKGPAASRVVRLDVLPQPVCNYSGFEIR